jgi:zinc protease
LPDRFKVAGIEDRELPLVRFEVAIDGGQLMDSLHPPGAGHLVAQMLPRGTARRSAAEFESAKIASRGD